MIILVTDDDRLVRFSIKSMLGDILGDSGDVILEAKDGKDMVRICSESQPDIAFVDIRMPNLDGLAAIEECRKFSEETEFVIVSGYSDFQYAQRGIRLGVTEYLLKPVDEEELQRVMGKLLERVTCNKRESNSRFQIEVMETFNYYSTVGRIGTEETPVKEGNTLLTFMLRIGIGRNNGGYTVEVQQKLLEEIRRLGNMIIGRKGYYAVAVNGYGTFCTVFCVKEEEKENILSHMSRISKKVLKEDGAMYYFLWFAEKTLANVCVKCEKLERSLPYLMHEKPGTVCSEEKLVRGEKEREVLHLIDRMAAAWREADGVVCRDIMNQIWRNYREEQLQLNFKNISTYCSFVTGCDIEGGTLREFCTAFVNSTDKIYDTACRYEIDVIEQTKSYIQKHYMSDISISKIAEQFNLTANYLSTIFHHRTGKRFIDYLSETRVEAAKKLLVENASASVQDIALMVGYGSVRHFSSLFQKLTGVTPSVYRKEHN